MTISTFRHDCEKRNPRTHFVIVLLYINPKFTNFRKSKIQVRSYFFLFYNKAYPHVLRCINSPLYVLKKAIVTKLRRIILRTNTIQFQIQSKIACGERQHIISHHLNHQQQHPCEQPYHYKQFINPSETDRRKHQS